MAGLELDDNDDDDDDCDGGGGGGGDFAAGWSAGGERSIRNSSSTSELRSLEEFMTNSRPPTLTVNGGPAVFELLDSVVVVVAVAADCWPLALLSVVVLWVGLYRLCSCVVGSSELVLLLG